MNIIHCIWIEIEESKYRNSLSKDNLVTWKYYFFNVSLPLMNIYWKKNSFYVQRNVESLKISCLVNTTLWNVFVLFNPLEDNFPIWVIRVNHNISIMFWIPWQWFRIPHLIAFCISQSKFFHHVIVGSYINVSEMNVQS